MNRWFLAAHENPEQVNDLEMGIAENAHRLFPILQPLTASVSSICRTKLLNLLRIRSIRSSAPTMLRDRRTGACTAFVASLPVNIRGDTSGKRKVLRLCSRNVALPCMKVGSPLLLGMVTAAAAAVLLTDPSGACAYGLTSAGRVEKCRGDEACISTSSVSNPSKFGPPWTFAPQTSDPAEAWAALKNAVESNPDHGRIVESLNGPDVFYLRAEFPSFPKGIEYVVCNLRPRACRS
jgi:hypothetical protein